MFLRTLTVAIFVLVLAIDDDCLGQQSPSDLSEATLEDLGSIQVYSASKRQQSSGDAPSSVTVISADEIQKQGYRTLADLLRTVRSFYVTYDRLYSSLGVRGFARPGDFNTRILLLVDGHRLNDNIYDEAMIGTEFPIDLDLIQRIEIVRGPVSSLYGSNALFAAINIITKDAENVKGLEVSTEGASFNTYKTRISYGRDLQQTRFLISGSFYRSLGHSRIFYPEFNAPETNSGIASHTDDDQLGTAFGVISSHDLALESAYGTREKGISTGAYDTLFNDPGTRSTDSHGFADLRYRHTFRNSLEVLARTFYDRYTYQGTYIYPSDSDPSQICPNFDFADGQWWGTDLQLTRSLSVNNRVTVGGEYRNNLRQNQNSYNANPFSLLLDDKRHSSVAAFFFEDEIAPSKTIALNLGLRYDVYDAIESSTTPRVALIWKPQGHTAIKGIYGEAFRVPNVYEKYYSVAPNIANPTLRPERIRSAELVWEQSMSKPLWVTISAFQNTLKDLITQQSLNNGLFMFENLQRAKSVGIETELKGQRSNGFESIVSYGFSESKDRDSEQSLSNSPRHLAKLNLIQPLLRKSLFASLDAHFRSGLTTFTGRSVFSFTCINANLLGRTLGKHLDVSAGVYNLLDETYYDPPSTAVSLQSIKQDGRSFRLAMTWKSGAR